MIKTIDSKDVKQTIYTCESYLDDKDYYIITTPWSNGEGLSLSIEDSKGISKTIDLHHSEANDIMIAILNTFN